MAKGSKKGAAKARLSVWAVWRKLDGVLQREGLDFNLSRIFLREVEDEKSILVFDFCCNVNFLFFLLSSI